LLNMNQVHKKLGELLKLERERRRVSLDDLSIELKIPLASLESVESGDISTLPSEVYYSLFAKSYAEALGIDYARTIEAIKEDIGESLEPVEPSGAERAESALPDQKGLKEHEEGPKAAGDESSGYVKKLALIMGAIIAAFIVFLGLNMLLSGDDSHEASREVPATTETEPAEEPESGDEDALYASYDWNVPEYAAPQPFTLRLAARGESWATILADGDTAVFRNMLPGRVYTVTAKHRMRVSVAVPSQVDIELNGQPVNLVNPEDRRISRVEITQVNLQSVLARETEPAPAIIRQKPPARLSPDAEANMASPPVADPGDTGSTAQGATNEH
jgi:cytoskeleton protein RodZ